jgi:hypothetical protein
MSSGGAASRTTEQQAAFARQATILRKNLIEWDRMLRTPRGEDWPTMLGRLNAALNQTITLDKSIDDIMEHFVFLPKKATANPQDIPFFLSTRLESEEQEKIELTGDPVKQLTEFENYCAKLASRYEENMVRF